LWQAFSESKSEFSGSGKNYLGELTNGGLPKLVKLHKSSSAATVPPPSAITSSQFNHKWPRDQQQFFPGQNSSISFEVRQFTANSSSPQSSAIQQSWVTERVIGNASTPYVFWL
jgi:hypothetical protein